MRKYSSNLAFVDLLFNLLVGFTSLLLLAFLLINPIADEGKIDPVSEFLITISWPQDSHADIDVWLRDPNGGMTSFRRKDGQWIVLERDDLGSSNDWYTIDGKPTLLLRNLETISINAVVPGEYVLNIHNYSFKRDVDETSEKYPIPVEVEMHKMRPYRVAFNLSDTLEFRQEKTIATWVVTPEGEISDLRTDIKIPLFYKGPGASNSGRIRDGDNTVNLMQNAEDPAMLGIDGGMTNDGWD